MPRARGRIFAAGIVWNPREPLPNEYQADPHYQRDDEWWRAGSGHNEFLPGSHRPRPGGLTQIPPSDAYGAFIVNPAVAPPGNVIATTTAVKKVVPKSLPDLVVQEAGRNILPPLSISLAASVIQDTAEVTVTQTFWNNAANPIKEASYTFPLPAGCTVTDFTCRIGTNKIIRGNVKPREEAREAFKHHIRHHKTGAALLEQDTPEVFTTTLGNIPAETRLKVTLSFITLLKHRFSESLATTTLTIPTYIANRYGSPPDGYTHADSKDVTQGLALKIEIIESEKVQSITSPSHGVTVEHRKGKGEAESFADLAGDGSASRVETALVQLEANSAFLDKDFVLDIVTHPNGDNETPQAWLEEHPTLPTQHALMVTLPPKFLGQTSPAEMDERGEVLFLADQSGSMYDKIDALKSAMQFFLKGIPVGKTFNIWSFGSEYTSWCSQSVDYNEGTLDAALAHVDKTFHNDMGGTELFPAIQAVVAARDKTLMTDIIILTDGETWRLEDTLDFIQQTRIRTEGRVRFFSLGIGDGVSHALVEGIAKAGGGYAEVVPSSVRDGWEDRVVSMLQASLSTAHLGPLHFDFAVKDNAAQTSTPVNLISPESSKRSPADISTLTPFNHNRVYFLSTAPIPPVPENSSITLSITTPLGTKTPLSIPVVILPKKGTTIHKLAARSLLNDLERGQSHLHLKQPGLYRDTWAETSLVKREAEEIACKWGLVSKWTSFFLKEEPYQPKEGDEIDWFLEGAVIKVKLGLGAMEDDMLQARGTAAAFVPPALEAGDPAAEKPEKADDVLPKPVGMALPPLGDLPRPSEETQADAGTAEEAQEAQPAANMYNWDPNESSPLVSSYEDDVWAAKKSRSFDFDQYCHDDDDDGSRVPQVHRFSFDEDDEDDDGYARAPRRRRDMSCLDSDPELESEGEAVEADPALKHRRGSFDTLGVTWIRPVRMATRSARPAPSGKARKFASRHTNPTRLSDPDTEKASPPSTERIQMPMSFGSPPRLSSGSAQPPDLAAYDPPVYDPRRYVAAHPLPPPNRVVTFGSAGPAVTASSRDSVIIDRDSQASIRYQSPSSSTESRSQSSRYKAPTRLSDTMSERYQILDSYVPPVLATYDFSDETGEERRSLGDLGNRSTRPNPPYAVADDLFAMSKGAVSRNPNVGMGAAAAAAATAIIMGPGTASQDVQARNANDSRSPSPSSATDSRSSRVRFETYSLVGECAPGNWDSQSQSRDLDGRRKRVKRTPSRSQSRSRSRSRDRDGARTSGGVSSLAALATAGLGASGAKKQTGFAEEFSRSSRVSTRDSFFSKKEEKKPEAAATETLDSRSRSRSPSRKPAFIGPRPGYRQQDEGYSDASPPAIQVPTLESVPSTDQDWIRLVLQYQRFNGAFDPPTPRIARVCLGKDILEAAYKLCDLPRREPASMTARETAEELDTFYLTLAVYIILVRDFGAHAALVSLMKAKMWRFLQATFKTLWGAQDGSGPEERGQAFGSLEELQGLMEKALAGLRVPVHSQSQAGGIGEEKAEEEEAMMEAKTPARELVLSAPCDD